MATFKLVHVVGTRPNFMKVAPIMAAVNAWNDDTASRTHSARLRVHLDQVLIHTGQHYDERMSRVFFEELGLPRPDHFLHVGSGSHAEMTAKVMLALEPILIEEQPDLVVVVGDVNSTLAAALVAAKLQIPVAHVEAGLRSHDRTMPEELNRLVTDRLSDLLFTTSRDADDNLRAEGASNESIFFVGNTMIDTLEHHRRAALARPILERFDLQPGCYGVVTLHRPSNVDDMDGLKRLVRVLGEVSSRVPLVFPVHARTRKHLESHRLLADGEANARLVVTEPLGYLDFLGLLAQARIVLTDSGGIQEETTVLGIPCVTLRKNTERPVTVWEGTNRLVDPGCEDAVLDAVSAILAEPADLAPRRPALWDGQAARRIVEVIAVWLNRRQDERQSRRA